MDKQKPSEVFLEIWQAITTVDSELPPESFARYAAAWRQIVSLEEIYAEAESRRAMQDMLDAIGARSLISGRADEGVGPYKDERSDSDRMRPTPTTKELLEAGFGPTRASAPTEEPKAITYDCASAPMPEDVQEAARAAAAKSEAGKASMDTRKRRCLEALDAARAAGVTMAAIAEAGPGLTISDVMDALDRRPLPLPKLAALEKALVKLSGEDAPPPSGERGR